MSIQPGGIAEAALQLETAAVQLRALSILPEAERDGSIKKAIQDIRDQVSRVDNRTKKLSSDFQSLRDTTDNRMKELEAQAFNAMMRHHHQNLTETDEKLTPFHDHKTNKSIPGFPLTARDFRFLSGPDCDRISDAIGWDVSDFDVPGKQDWVIDLAGVSTLVPKAHW